MQRCPKCHRRLPNQTDEDHECLSPEQRAAAMTERTHPAEPAGDPSAIVGGQAPVDVDDQWAGRRDIA